MQKSHHNTIEYLNCKIRSQQKFAGEQFILSLEAPSIAKRAKAGQFVHLSCDASLPLRRPMSIMLADGKKGNIDLLYKIVGSGTKKLSEQKAGDYLSVLGPIGNGFRNNTEKKRPLLIGGGLGIPPVVCLAQQIRHNVGLKPFVILGSEIPFPFITVKSKLNNPHLKASCAMKLLENWGIASSLTSCENYPCVFQGYTTELAEAYLKNLTKEELAEVEIYACGPQIMLKAVARLARFYDLEAQISLEEYMACATGGCAGCAIEVKNPLEKTNINEKSLNQKNAYIMMQRVCVDGPVFFAKHIF